MKDNAAFNKKKVFHRGGRRYRRCQLGLILILLCLASVFTGAGTVWADAREDQLPETAELLDAFLYYIDPTTTHLKAVHKPFPSGLSAHELGLAVLEALMAGPSTPGLERIFPEQTRINALFITKAGDAYIDLGLDLDGFNPSDTMTEYLRVYSLVNTLTVNIPEIKQVKILVNGSDGAGLGSHLRLDGFFKTNMLIVK